MLERTNLHRALKQVRQNKGAPGIDAMTVDALPAYLKHAWPELREQLVDGSYRPRQIIWINPPGIPQYDMVMMTHDRIGADFQRKHLG